MLVSGFGWRSEIVDIGRYTYFLTPTRLYVVEDRTKLAAFLDVFQQGRLLVSQSGFGLLTSKKLQWFTAAGAKVGELLTRDPIRTVHTAEGQLQLMALRRRPYCARPLEKATICDYPR